MSDLPFHEISSQLAFLGPPLEQGPLPSLFYLSLSCQDSLLLDPFNQMPAYVSQFPLRIFSLTLPFHEKPLSPLKALESWAQEIQKGNDILAPFLDQIENALFFLQKEGALIPEKLAISGLSRGVFFALHIAAKIPSFRTILGFAPLLSLSLAKEFLNTPLPQHLESPRLIPLLTNRSLRFYIGNLDTRVGTSHCFHFVEKLSQAAYLQGIRSPPIELIITPSIGRDGHGTSQQIFEQGGKWLLQQLGFSDV